MARRRTAIRPDVQELALERRELLATAAATASRPADFGPAFSTRFNHDGISNLLLHKTFVDLLNDRLNVSKNATNLIYQAFQAFKKYYTNLPATGGSGQPPSTGGGTTNPSQGSNPSANATGASGQSSTQAFLPPAPASTLPGLLDALTREVDKALSTIQLNTTYVGPSVVREPKYTPAAQQALIPFANAQIAAMGAELAAQPGVAGPNGTTVPADPTPALDAAYDAIMNALAENSVHPALFPTAGDFYLNPNARFDITFNGTPATQGAGYFLFGPGGVLLPGAPTHPHVAVKLPDGSARPRN